MPRSIWSPKLHTAFAAAKAQTKRTAAPAGAPASATPAPYPSPVDWRDVWIYMIMIDRFNNPKAPPKSAWDHRYGQFQGGTFEGVRQQLDYLRDLGVGAIWLTPVLKNCQ